MSDDAQRDVRSDVAEWIVYLKEIGVRELRASSASLDRLTPFDPLSPRQMRGPSPRNGPELAGVDRPRPRPRRSSAGSAAPTGAAEGPGQATLGDLDQGLLGPAPADPAKALLEVRDDLGDCTRCKLSERRQNIVFGVGDPRAGLMFIGEGPGADEDAQGEPFVGKAGKKLDEMIEAIGLARSKVYIANIVKCRPPQNRDPEPDEVATCSPFLLRQIGAIRPKVIVTLGSPATKTLLNTKVGITKLRGIWQSYAGIPVMPTFHPAYLLRAYTLENRKRVWNDLQAARSRLDDSS